MNLVVVGTNHKFSPIEIRERLCFPKRKLGSALISLLNFKEVYSAVILSTCNRVELYASSPDREATATALKHFLAFYQNQDLEKLRPLLYTYIDKQAISHLFKVAAGLDSQIIGETQILEQVRFAYQQAKEIGATDDLLSYIFAAAINSGIKVRNSSEIAKGDISVASIAIALMQETFHSLHGKRILIIGVGKISEFIARELKEKNIAVTFIANRTYAKAAELARFIDAEVLGFDQLREKLPDADIIISATASPHFILKKEDFLKIKKPLLVIDLALPRDIEPEVKFIEGINFFSLDDLDFIVEKEIAARKQAIPRALKIIEAEIENLCLSEYSDWELEPACLP